MIQDTLKRHPRLFVEQYMERLNLPTSTYELDTKPTYELLCTLQEAHLTNIPFENLSQHGCTPPVVLDLEVIATKVLDRKRGGFCLELNNLFGALLRICGYHVTTVPATVYQGTFENIPPSRIALLVKTHVSSTDVYYVDVGFGEPPLIPLKVSYHVEQVSPEGMVSRICPDDNGNAVLQWRVMTSRGAEDSSRVQQLIWEPRLRWCNIEHKQTNATLEDMYTILNVVTRPDSKFSKKSVVCLLSRDYKRTMAGSSYKITGSPRYPKEEVLDGQNVPVHKTENLDVSTIQDIRDREFSIPKEETSTLDLEKSNMKEAAELWTNW